MTAEVTVAYSSPVPRAFTLTYCPGDPSEDSCAIRVYSAIVISPPSPLSSPRLMYPIS